MNNIITLILLSISISVFGQSKITGTVSDSLSNESLIGATVFIQQYNIGVATDMDGNFELPVNPGTYTVEVRYITYKNYQQIISIQSDEVKSIHIKMKEDITELSTINIVSTINKDSQTELIQTQKNSATVVDGTTAESFKKTPDSKASDVIKRISGASVQDNKFIVIRGLNDRYNFGLINGSPLPSSESDKRAFSFDIFPSNMVDNIMINKTATPDLPGEFSGGVININTVEPKDEKYQSIQIGQSYNSLTTFGRFSTYNGSKYDLLGLGSDYRGLPSGLPTTEEFSHLTKVQKAEYAKLIKNDWSTYNIVAPTNQNLQYSLGKNWKYNNYKSSFGYAFAYNYQLNYNTNTLIRREFEESETEVIKKMELKDSVFTKNILNTVLLNLKWDINEHNTIRFKNMYSINSEDKTNIRNGVRELDNDPRQWEKSTLWVVQEKSNSYAFDINLDKLIIQAPGPKLRGPNFNINIPDQNNVATSYQNYTSLVNSVQNVSTSSYQQLLSLITSQSIDINVDYTDFTNFTFFGSAKQRLINFYGKVKQIEDYNNLISAYTPNITTTSSLSLEITSSKNAINTIISQFDGYEYYLYFESSSYTWPKTTNTTPYILATTSSAQTWYNAITGSAESYDDNNQNNLVFVVPAFIKDDGNNAPYITFLNMVGHYFDNIWIFLQAVTDINLANNNLEKGVSKDLVYYVLQSLGVNLYNQYGDSDNVNFLVGVSGSAYYTGSDNQAFTYTGSYLNAIPRKDLLAESYKRIYHNLPLLLKTKGTAYGLQTLVSTFGITGSVLQVKEYGGDIRSKTLDEFNNDKIRIVSNNITGSVLSPHISLQQSPTSSTIFRTNDLHYVDISFSPQDKIDIFTSASITSTNPTWSVDDFIGDPRYQYNSSYPTLEVERTKYLSPLTASIIPYSGSSASGSIGATDYSSFIRLIQFFDNSLFKMLKDYVPARANLSTGITISSPILERNKWVIANPSSTSEIEVEGGTINGPSIQTEYTDLYQDINYNNKVAYYDGTLTGSYINVYSYFESSSRNPYLFPTGSVDINKFLHSDFNVLLNNVSQSLLSRVRQDIQFIPGTTQSILSPAELQDSYESLRTHQLSRYEGVKKKGGERSAL